MIPRHLSPKPSSVSASTTNVATLTDSSPRLVRTTSPTAPTQSPMRSSPNRSKDAVSAASANSWTSPVESRSVAKASLPCGRTSITRPATETVVPDSSPGASAPKRSTTSRAKASWAKE